jgi:NitT/TauT family transport system substrate-binding protein
MCVQKVVTTTMSAVLLVIFGGAAMACQSQPAETPPPDPVTVQLKWIHQAQFAGFYLAQEKGYYAAENIDVIFIEGGPGIDVIDPVVLGKADFAVAAPERILLRRSEGQPIVAIATTYRHNPFVLVTMADSGIERPEDFAGKTVAVGNIDGLAQFEAILSNLGLEPGAVNIVDYDFDLTPFYNFTLPRVPYPTA